MKKENRGGKREGSGRKPSITPRHKLQFQIYEDLLEQLPPPPHRGDFINAAIRAYLEAEILGKD